MRIALGFIAMILAASTASAADYFWISEKTDSGAMAALVGCKECDDIALRMVCDRASKTIKIDLYSNHAGSEPQGKGADRVVFRYGDKKTVRAAAMNFDEMNGAWLPTVTINARDPLLRRMLKAESLTIEANGQNADITLENAETHLKKLRRGCR